jgi:hypothetical protein
MIKAPRSELFASKSRLQKQCYNPEKGNLSLSLGEDGFCSSETTHDRRTANVLYFGKEITGTKATTAKYLSLVLVQLIFFL